MKKRKIAIRVSLVLIITLFAEYSLLYSQSSAVAHESSDSADLVRTYEEIWKSDSCGCESKREIYMGKAVLDANNLRGKCIDSVFSHMGRCTQAYIRYYLSHGDNCSGRNDSIDKETVLVLHFDQYGLVSYDEEVVHDFFF